VTLRTWVSNVATAYRRTPDSTDELAVVRAENAGLRERIREDLHYELRRMA
jgi:hypothetical protein